MKNSFLETIKILDAKVYNIDFHQKRYERVLGSFGKDTFKDLLSLIEAPAKGLYRCRLVYTLDNTIKITYHPYVKRDVQSLKIIYDDSIDYPIKYENRDILNQLFEKKEECDDILIVKNDYVTDTSIANIAFYNGNFWITPRSPLLYGTTRQRLLQNNKIQEADIRVNDLKTYSKVALLNAMIDFDIIANISYVNSRTDKC